MAYVLVLHPERMVKATGLDFLLSTWDLESVRMTGANDFVSDRTSDTKVE